MDRRERLVEMIRELVSIPSVTEGPHESEPGLWIKARLEKLAYFKENPENLKWIETPLEGTQEKLHSLVVRVDAAGRTERTVLLISHYDVVGVEVYGENAQSAFDIAALNRIFDNRDGNVLYGRGIMDMKSGVALELDVVEEFAGDRSLYDVNIVAAFVGDEENASAGMRGAVPTLAALKTGGMDFIAAINTEPGEAGDARAAGPRVFLGTLGKLMPGFYVRGCAAHVGNCYKGFSAALAISHLVECAECSPSLANPLRGKTQPSWICLDMGVMRKTYSVTVPDRAYAYFNCFTTTSTPADIVGQMRSVALSSFIKTSRQLSASCDELAAMGYDGAPFSEPEPKVFTLYELTEKARTRCGADFDASLDAFVDSLPADDMRQRGIRVVDHIAGLSGEEGPYIVCFFLPPWLPVRTDITDDKRDASVVAAAREVEAEIEQRYGMKMAEAEFFAGLCDLSYVGAKVSCGDLEDFRKNMPGWGGVYSIPLDEMNSLGMAVINMGPSGDDPHKETERLYLHYSLDILPDMLRGLIRKLSARV